MGFLIPTARPNPSLLTRFGRLLHWTALGFAALTLLPVYFAATQAVPASVQAASVARLAAPQSAPMANAPAADPWAMFDGLAQSRPLQPAHQQGLPYEFWLTTAAVFALAGRAARYLFAGE